MAKVPIAGCVSQNKVVELTIVHSERREVEGVELRQVDRDHALLFPGSSSSLWFERNSVSMKKLS